MQSVVHTAPFVFKTARGSVFYHHHTLMRDADEVKTSRPAARKMDIHQMFNLILAQFGLNAASVT